MSVRTRARRTALLAIAIAASLGVSAPVAAANPNGGSTTAWMSDPECAAIVALTGKPPAKACVLQVSTGTGSPDGAATAAVACYVPPGYTHCGSAWVKSQSLLWNVTSTATFVRNASTGKVVWQSVTCTKAAFIVVITITWCGSYHNGLPDTNFGSNFDVSALIEGSPLTVSHGHRASINGFTGAACCLQSW